MMAASSPIRTRPQFLHVGGTGKVEIRVGKAITAYGRSYIQNGKN